MFRGIKCNNLKMLRTLPNIWITFVNGVPHCWIPRIGYSFKLKNLVQPPNETDMEGRKEWHYSDCEILFNKEFRLFNDCEMALSKLDYGPEWYFKPDAETSTAVAMPPVDTSVLTNELSTSSNQTELTFTATENYLVPLNVETLPPDPVLPSEQYPVDNLCPETENCFSPQLLEHTSSILPGHKTSASEPDHLVNESSKSSCQAVDDLQSSKQFDKIPFNDQTLPPDPLVQSESLTSSTEQHPVENIYTATENEFSSQLPENSPSSNLPEHSPSPSLSGNSKSSDQNHQIFNDLEQYNENKRLCRLFGFKPPIHYRRFEKMQFKYVKTFNVNDLQTGCTFKTLQELSLIPRKYDKPFCRPGPLLREELYDWYLVDSIVQQVHLKTVPFPFFVVRWVGYEDEFNTVEPLPNVKHTAVYKLFTNPDLYTSHRLNGCILRRSARNVLPKTCPLQIMDIEPSMYERAMNKLATELKIEEEAGRYSPEIGFFSTHSVVNALSLQHEFFINKFCLLIKQLQSTLCLDRHYIGPIFGTLSHAAEFKKLVRDSGMLIVSKAHPLKDYITRGLSGNSEMQKDLPRYVSFLVGRKFDTAEKKGKNQLNFHMCVFIVRANGGQKDAIYYDPSPKYFSHQLPTILDNLTEPVMESFTHNFGNGSEKDDCVFQCMQYIIGIATGEVPFAPDLSEPCRKIDKYMAERAAKKMRLDN